MKYNKVQNMLLKILSIKFDYYFYKKQNYL